MTYLSQTEIEQLNDLLANLRPHLSLALSEHINEEIALEMPDAREETIADIAGSDERFLSTSFRLTAESPFDGVLLLGEQAAAILIGLMEGGEPLSGSPDLKPEQVEALSAVMTRLVRGLATALATRSGFTTGMERVSTRFGELALPASLASERCLVRARLTLTLPDMLETDLTLLLGGTDAKALVRGGGPAQYDTTSELPNTPEPVGDPAPSATPAQTARHGSDDGGTEEELAAPPFVDFPKERGVSLPTGFGLILDIPLEVTVELGRARMLIKDVLQLAEGSVMELDRVAGEPVDVKVNGRLVAKGEVVVIEDNFGVRITEIISPADRVAGLTNKGQ